MTGPAAPAIRIDGLTFRYPGADRPAVDRVSFEVARGEVVGFLGPSGAGKSTTQQLLTGRLHGGDRRVEVLGRDPARFRPHERARIGVSFEQPALFPKLSAREQLGFFAALAGTRRRARDPVDVLDRLGLAGVADQRVGTFSKGMRTRLDLARALLLAPDVLFLDEPTGGLDPVSAARVREVIAVERDRGAAVLLTTHDMALAADLADRVALLAEGRLVAVGEPRTLALAAGGRQVVVTTHAGARSERPLAGLGEDRAFLELLARDDLATIHTTEPSLADLFLQLTGAELGARGPADMTAAVIALVVAAFASDRLEGMAVTKAMTLPLTTSLLLWPLGWPAGAILAIVPTFGPVAVLHQTDTGGGVVAVACVGALSASAWIVVLARRLLTRPA